jgi:hypothetical protein
MLRMAHHPVQVGLYLRIPTNKLNESPWLSTMKRFINWLSRKFADDISGRETPLRRTGAHRIPKPPARKPATQASIQYSAQVNGEILDVGPGKNVLIRNKYIREDSGTHETLKIVDDSLLDSVDEFGIDPYNTGRFDRSRSWDSPRSRK